MSNVSCDSGSSLTSSLPLSRAPAPHQAQANQFPSDPRYHGQNTNYASYPSRTPSAIPQGHHDSRTLPPLSSQQGQYFPQTTIPSQPMGPTPHIRSQSAAGYPGQYGAYPTGQVPHATPFYAPSDPRMASSPVSATSYDTVTGAPLPRRSSMSVDRTVPSRMSAHGLPPYARAPPSLSSEYDREPVNEPTIKKKRKRAGTQCTHQLKPL